MEGVWPIVFLAVVLKIPVFFGIWLVWWASKSYDEFAEDERPGAEDHGFRRWRREPRPKGPRRGPHGGTAAAHCRTAHPAAAGARRESSRASLRASRPTSGAS